MNEAALSGSTPDWLRQRALSTPDRLALIAGSQRATWTQLDAAVNNASRVLSYDHVGRGSTVAVLSGNCAAFVVAVHAIVRLGGVLLPLNVRLTPTELAWQVADAGAALVLADKANMAIANTLGPLVSSLEEVASLNGRSETFGVGRFDLATPMSVVYTSGTTGRPKGAVLTYGNHLWSAVGSALNLGLRDDDRWLAALPLFHVGGLAILLRSVIYGMTAVVHESFDAARANAAIDDDGVTIVSVVANMLQRMLAERALRVPQATRTYPPHLRCMLLGGGPAPQPLLEACAARGVPVVQTYGLTEAASQVTALAPEDALSKLGSAGKPLFGTELRIVASDSDRAEGEPGEILVRGPTVTPGYLNQPVATAEALEDGWLHTGDLGYLDAEGYLYVLDRRDDLIVSGGENVYPAEVESALQSHPAVLEAGVVGVPHERWGQVPVAVVVLRPGAVTTAEELIEFCRGRLAGYKTPHSVTFIAALPRNAAGKLVRAEVRRLLIRLRTSH
jgi:O-succinylbenzoic acid--CoA ligase